MQINSVLKVVIVLLLIMIISLSGALLIIKKNGKAPADTGLTSDTVQGETTTAEKDTSDVSETSASDTDEITTSEITTAPDPVDPVEPVDPPVDPVDPVEPVDPPTDPTVTAPKGFSLTKEFKSNTGTKLNTRIVCNAIEENGKVRLTVEMYLDYRSLQLGARREKDCSLTVGGQKIPFTTDKIAEDSNEMHSMLLCSSSQYVEYGKAIQISSSFAARVVYSGVEIGKIVTDDTLLIK